MVESKVKERCFGFRTGLELRATREAFDEGVEVEKMGSALGSKATEVETISKELKYPAGCVAIMVLSMWLAWQLGQLKQLIGALSEHVEKKLKP